MLPSTGDGTTYCYLNACDIANLVAINATHRSDSKSHQSHSNQILSAARQVPSPSTSDFSTLFTPRRRDCQCLQAEPLDSLPI